MRRADSIFLPLALDRDSVREYRRDGQLIVKRAHITKANVCPYRGDEIPGWQKLGLDPQKIYKLFRDPEELKKAAPSLNGVQLMIKHVPVNSDDPHQDKTVGSLGTDAEPVEENGEIYLDNSLFVNTQDAIDAIESGKQRELSAGYHYTPDMTPGVFRGNAFDGIMRDIVFNHVALVEDGRAGPDVVVGDSSENVKMARRLAVKIALDGKTHKGFALDASPEHVKTVLDALEGAMPAGAGDLEDKDEEALLPEGAANGAGEATADPEAKAGAGEAFDAEPIMSFLKGKGMGAEDIKTVCDMLPKMKGALAGDDTDTPPTPAGSFKREEEGDIEDPDGKINGAMNVNKEPITKPAMDAAIKAAREQERGVHVARAKVKAWVGELPLTIAFDSAEGVYRHALKMRGRADSDKLHADALLPILESLPKAGVKAPEHTVEIAQDASTVSEAMKIAPGLEFFSTVL